jgi:hypothetical protein
MAFGKPLRRLGRQSEYRELNGSERDCRGCE